MKITILSAHAQNEHSEVSFSTSCGVGVARWEGPKPVRGATYFVELSSDDVLILGKNAEATPDTKEHIAAAANGKALILCATLAMLSEERTGVFELGDGRIELDLASPESWIVGGHYRIELSSLALFDQNY